MSECFGCKGFCCKYITVDLEKPEDLEDFDEIRWFILHKNVVVYKPEGEDEWRIEFRSPCKYLDQVGNLCKEYDKRPEVCREYITDECGKHNELGSEGCDIYLETEEDLKKYLQEHHPEMVSQIFE